MPDVPTIVYSFGAAFVASIGGVTTAGFIAKTIFTERVRNAIRHEYDLKIETLKDELRRESEKQAEELKSKNLRDIEAVKSSLETSRAAAEILIKRRFQAYEDYFKVFHALSVAIVSLKVAHDGKSADCDNKAQASRDFYSALLQFDEWAQKSPTFMPRQASGLVYEIYESFHLMAGHLESGGDYEALNKKRLIAANKIEALIRADLLLICKTGQLPEISEGQR